MSEDLKINYTKFFLPNGIKCVLYQRKEIHSVNIQVTVNVGSLDENDKENGISHFIEHVAAGDGTEALPTWEKLADYVNEHSGSTNAYTSYDHTEYYGTFPSQYLDQSLFYFSQQVFFPLIREEDVDKERTIILDEKKSYEDTVDDKIYKNIKKFRFSDETTEYSQDIIGTEENLNRFKSADLREYYSKHYVPENIHIYIVGNIDVNEAKRLLEKHFHKSVTAKKFEAKTERQYKKRYPGYSGLQIYSDQKLDIDQYYLTVTFPSLEFALTDIVDRYKIGFLRSITASGHFPRSILWRRLREELNLVYGVYTYTNDMYARNYFAIQTSFKKEYLNTVIEEIYNGVNKIKQSGVSDDVFEAKKKKIIDTQLMELDSPNNILNWIRAYEDEIEEHSKGMTLQEYMEYIKDLKFEDIIEIANKVYDWDKVNIGIVSQDAPDVVKEDLKQIWGRREQLTIGN